MNANKTTIQTSQKRIEATNSKVKTEEEAKIACLYKWNLVKDYLEAIEDLADQNCGFCYLANVRAHPKYGKCDHCPDTISEYCSPMLQDINDQWFKIQTIVDQTILFLEKYQPEPEPKAKKKKA